MSKQVEAVKEQDTVLDILTIQNTIPRLYSQIIYKNKPSNTCQIRVIGF